MFRWEFSESRESISRIAVPGTLHARGPYSLTGDAHGTVGRPKSGEFLIYSVLQVGRDAILVRIFQRIAFRAKSLFLPGVAKTIAKTID